ncbi:MAG: flagellar hook-length control protein FliK [Burkholderiales bacterium]|nr:flagellar hook-length control protein FliK [Burkholderiales bacterium]
MIVSAVELGAVATVARPAGVADPRAGAEPAVDRFALSPRLVLPLLQGQMGADPALAQLARELAQQSAGEVRAITLVLPAGAPGDAQSARLEVSTRQVPISPALRDALLAQVAPPGQRDGALTAAAPALPPAPPGAVSPAADTAARAWATGVTAQAATTQLLSNPGAAAVVVAGAARDLLRALAPREGVAARAQTMHTIGFDRPLAESAALDAAPAVAASALSRRLREAIEHSGLFYESHLAQWTRQSRSADDVRAELLHLAGAGAAVAEAGAQRVAGQLAVLEQQAVALSGPAWAGQPLRIAIEREPPPRDAPAHSPPAFNATLALELPHLGAVRIELRLVGKAVATTVHSMAPERVRPGLDALNEQLCARGLTPVAAQAPCLEAPA